MNKDCDSIEMTGHCVGRESGHGLGQDSYWIAEVDVYLEEASDPPKFSLETCLPVNDSHQIVFRNRGRHGFKIAFHLHDLTRSGYRFPDKEKNALWSRVGEGCPPKNHNDQWKEFDPVKVIDGGMTLIVRNLNETRTQFGYVLRLTNDDGKNFIELDPGGDNDNGNFFANF